jgi:aldose 1-epimerase
MLERLTLNNGRIRAEVVPSIGGGLARLDWLGNNSPVPLLRPLREGSGSSPLPSQLACFPLLPWSNRLAATGFVFGERRYVPEPTRAGEPCPIHGDGWLHAWHVQRHEDSAIHLTLDRSQASPFCYTATLSYMLDDNALAIEIAVRNTGMEMLPFGIGLHPWMPDPEGALLETRSTDVWLAGPDKLPLVRRSTPAWWSFDNMAPLPTDGVDNAFEGWDGHARVIWPDRGVGLHIETDMGYYILYVPPGQNFFCVEPVDHPINAHNMRGQPGLTALAPGAILRRRCVFRGESL